jgi:PKD repeat protein
VGADNIGVTDMKSFSVFAAVASVLLLSACTMGNQEAPPLTGPSEFATSVTIAVTPDVLTQDGASQASILVTARNSSGAPLPGVTMRIETLVDLDGSGPLRWTRMDYGNLSARSIVTASDGRATATYTAPVASSGESANQKMVQIEVTPLGSDFSNTSSRVATLRLTPPGAILPTDGLEPDFSRSPEKTSYSENEPIIFDASLSKSTPDNPITGCTWDFDDDDDRTSTRCEQVHAFKRAGTYAVRLTISDGFGRSASKVKLVVVAPAPLPTPSSTSDRNR